MTPQFKQDLQKLINKAARDLALEYDAVTDSEDSFKAGCEFLIPLIEELIDQRDESVGYQEHLSSRSKLLLSNSYDKDLLNLLRGVRDKA